jgi:hypothetical protein
LTRSAELRRRFVIAFWREVLIVWPILCGLVTVQITLGMLVGILERWSVLEAAYFTFITGLTIGYGDFTPSRFVSQMISIAIGFTGILLTGLVAALGVHALNSALDNRDVC